MTPQDVKSALGKMVQYNGSEYKMTAYILRHGEKGFLYQAELQDPNGNSVIIAALDKIAPSEGEGRTE